MRSTINLNKNWLFVKNTADITANKGERIDLPHTWNASDGQDGGNDYFRGSCLYVKTLKKQELPRADRYYLEILGANSSADVYANKKKLTHHDGGYSTWRVDLTEHLEEDTELAIVVDNSPNEAVYPQMADFTFYGGLYRDVNLIAVSESHFDLMEHGSRGLKITPTVIGDHATVEVQVFVKNKKGRQRLQYTLYDRDGEELGRIESVKTAAIFELPHVHLWHGRRDPYLYGCQVELVEDGLVLDTVRDRFGCRSFEIHPERGFLLNGEEYPLRGVSRHQDRLGIGNALLPEHHREDMELILEMGATTVRLAHYQHDPYFYELCDESGLVVWAEIPYISKHLPGGRGNTVSQMTELILQNYNHPSIVVWGLSNEISIGGSGEDLLENHRVLNDLAHKLDPTRLTVVAAVSMCSMEDPYLQIPDAVSYNHYFGWYGGDTDSNGPWFDRFHKTLPHIPIGCSEYGCEALNWHTSTPKQGDYTEEYQAYYHEELIKQLFSRSYLWATHVWNMFDFGADARAEGGENGQNHKGLVTMDRKYKKDAFYAYKAWLSDEPFVHLCGKRYVDRVEDVTQVTVYSNQPEVELFANGVSVGKKTAPDHFFRFEVKNEGETTLVAKAGEQIDESHIRKVSEPNMDYVLRETGAVLNWFDVTEVEGHYSLNDKISTLCASEEGKIWFADWMKTLQEKAEAGKENGSGAFEMNFRAEDELTQMMGGFTLLRLTGLLSMMNVRFSKDELLEMNEALNRIPKQVERK